MTPAELSVPRETLWVSPWMARMQILQEQKYVFVQISPWAKFVSQWGQYGELYSFRLSTNVAVNFRHRRNYFLNID
jgi:hypothetical protein